jgi:hypothetical protein
MRRDGQESPGRISYRGVSLLLIRAVDDLRRIMDVVCCVTSHDRNDQCVDPKQTRSQRTDCYQSMKLNTPPSTTLSLVTRFSSSSSSKLFCSLLILLSPPAGLDLATTQTLTSQQDHFIIFLPIFTHLHPALTNPHPQSHPFPLLNLSNLISQNPAETNL